MVHLTFQVPAGLISAGQQTLSNPHRSTSTEGRTRLITRHPCWAVCGVYAKDHSAALARQGCTGFLGTKMWLETYNFRWPGLPAKFCLFGLAKRTPPLQKTHLIQNFRKRKTAFWIFLFIRICLEYTSPSMMYTFAINFFSRLIVSFFFNFLRPRLAFHCIQPATDLSQPVPRGSPCHNYAR